MNINVNLEYYNDCGYLAYYDNGEWAFTVQSDSKAELDDKVIDFLKFGFSYMKQGSSQGFRVNYLTK